MNLFVWIFFSGYLFGGLEYLFVCVESLLVWLWSSIEERFVQRKCWVLGEMLSVSFQPMFLFRP